MPFVSVLAFISVVAVCIHLFLALPGDRGAFNMFALFNMVGYVQLRWAVTFFLILPLSHDAFLAGLLPRWLQGPGAIKSRARSSVPVEGRSDLLLRKRSGLLCCRSSSPQMGGRSG